MSDHITGGDPYNGLAERIIFFGLTREELMAVGYLKPDRTFSDLVAAVDRNKFASVKSHGGLVAAIADAIRENVIISQPYEPRFTARMVPLHPVV